MLGKLTHTISFLVLLTVITVSICVSGSTVFAQPAPMVNYQGKLTDTSGVAVADGTYNVRFWLLQSVAQATTSAIWTESLTGANQVQITNGLFSVMLGSTSPLTSVDFNQELYLGVEIGGTGAASWDGELLPRKPLGTVPAAFESYKLGGVASSSFLRSDQSDTLAATTASTLLTIQQSGAGDLLSLLDGVANDLFTVTVDGKVGIGTTTMPRLFNVASTSGAGARFTDETNAVAVDVRSEDFQGFMGTFSNNDLRLITNNTSRLTVKNTGEVGIATTTPWAELVVGGDTMLAGGLYDNGYTMGGAGEILQTTGSGIAWVSTTTLGITTTDDDLSDNTTSDLAEGTNLYWTDGRFDTRLSATTSLANLATLAGLTTVGTIGTGVWQGTAIDSAYLDTNVLLDTELTSSADLAGLLSDETGTGNVVFSNNPLLAGFVSTASSTIGNGTASGGLTISGNSTTTGDAYFAGSVGIGTTSPNSILSLNIAGFDGAGVMGIDQYLHSSNTVESAVQYGNRFFLQASNTATTTIVGSMLRLKDDTEYGNLVRGLEVQAHRGANTEGENTAISAFGRTFGMRAVTTGEAGSVYEPAAGFFETEGTIQGNAVRGYSDTITTASLFALFQTDSDFDGTGLEMNFGNGAGGSFASTTSRYLDFQNGGTSVFSVSAFGTTTIGVNDGSTANLAGLLIPYGGICVDNDGTCTASTSGRITSVESQTGNSDLAEMYFSSDDLEPGELITLAGGLSITRANQDDTLPILGVVSTKPGLTLGYDDTSLEKGETPYPVALKGRVPVQLSTENGPIKKGDKLMLSSLPGIAAKATGTATVVGIALEDFDDTRMYSDTYLNQFGDDMVDPVYEPIVTNTDPRINDGCYFGGGGSVDEALCVPLVATTTDTQIVEANHLLEEETVAEEIEKLRLRSSETVSLTSTAVVKVGQIVMFVDRSEQWLTPEMEVALLDLTMVDMTPLLSVLGTEKEVATSLMATVIEAISTLWDKVTQHDEKLRTLEERVRLLEGALQSERHNSPDQAAATPAEATETVNAADPTSEAGDSGADSVVESAATTSVPVVDEGGSVATSTDDANNLDTASTTTTTQVATDTETAGAVVAGSTEEVVTETEEAAEEVNLEAVVLEEEVLDDIDYEAEEVVDEPILEESAPATAEPAASAEVS